MKDRTRLHDGIVGVLVTLGCLFGFLFDNSWFFLPTLIGILLIQSYYTGFCPVYYALDRIAASKPPSEASKSA
ncbi:MAG: YgaP family membrane protein [Methylococcales bacterium]